MNLFLPNFLKTFRSHIPRFPANVFIRFHRFLALVTVGLGLAGLFGQVQVAAGAFSGIIDNFSENQATITGSGNSTLDGSMVGGERDLLVTASMNATVSAGVDSGVLH